MSTFANSFWETLNQHLIPLLNKYALVKMLRVKIRVTQKISTGTHLTDWGRVTHIFVSKLTIIGLENGLPPGWRQAIIWTNAGIVLIGPLGTNFSEILIEIYTLSFKKIHLKMSSAKWQAFCPGLSVSTLLLGVYSTPRGLSTLCCVLLCYRSSLVVFITKILHEIHGAPNHRNSYICLTAFSGKEQRSLCEVNHCSLVVFLTKDQYCGRRFRVKMSSCVGNSLARGQPYMITQMPVK